MTFGKEIFRRNLEEHKMLESVEKLLKNPSKYHKNDIIDCILFVSMNKVDFSIAEKVCRAFIFSHDSDIRGIAITAVGHIGRVYEQLVSEDILEKIYESFNDPADVNYYRADEALSDLKIFLNYDCDSKARK